MAALSEISGLINDPVLYAKCKAAGLIAAAAVIAENGATTNHANRVKWAKRMFTEPESQGWPLLRAVIAANNSATLAQINAASDAAIQTAVNAAIDTLADGS